ncbi:MAG: VTT domain-containing protein [Reyranellaceae bacterium]
MRCTAVSVFRPGHNVWKLAPASRAAVLVDAANFFAALRAACLKAERRILIVGWDIDSRTPLVGASGRPDDGLPASFAEFLAELVRSRPGLEVDLLLWDYSLLYAGERELLPRLSLQWSMPQNVTLRLDDTVPFGCSQHQKIVVIDDALAFSGGLDLTIRRWDTPGHDADNHHRVDPSGVPYRPFHDVQMMVDGAAAHALALLARQRWCRAGEGRPRIEPTGDPWPDEIVPEFRDVEIAIARTQPGYVGEKGIHEVEALYVDLIDQAERHLYIENQFLTSRLVARRLARQLQRRPELEVVLVAPRSHDSWVERRTMRNGRIRFWREVRAAGGDRVRLLYPAVAQAGKKTDTMIHSKVMVVDDRFLRIGSSNLNNRSMGVDTECDLAVEGRSAAERAAIAEVRNRLLGEHCGVPAESVAAALERDGSLVAAADRLAANGHSLQPIEDGAPDRQGLSALAERVADPGRPIRVLRWAGRLAARVARPGLPMVAGGVLLLLVAGLTLAWRFTDLSQIAAPDRLAAWLGEIGQGPLAAVLVLAAFLVAGAVAFPINIMILATSVAFGPWLGTLYSAVGAFVSALLMYGVGARFGRDPFGRLFGARWQRALAGLRARGIVAVVTLRLLPVAPFTLVNLGAGASGIRLADFALGTALGMVPGLGLMAVMGDRLVELVRQPNLQAVALFALCAALWIGLAIGAQAVLARRGGRAQ